MIMSRRNMIAAAAAGSVASVTVARAAQLGHPDSPAQGEAAIKGNPASTSDPGPRNPALAGQFPDSEMPPSTDHGSVPNF
jgi:oxalate decarboxylase